MRPEPTSGWRWCHQPGISVLCGKFSESLFSTSFSEKWSSKINKGKGFFSVAVYFCGVISEGKQNKWIKQKIVKVANIGPLIKLGIVNKFSNIWKTNITKEKEREQPLNYHIHRSGKSSEAFCPGLGSRNTEWECDETNTIMSPALYRSWVMWVIKFKGLGSWNMQTIRRASDATLGCHRRCRVLRWVDF